MKSLNTLQSLLRDASLLCDVSTSRDWITIQSRFENEGLSFLTITLPVYTSWLEESLEAGQVAPSIFSSFKRKKGSTSPLFLNGLVERIFDARTGVLREDADPSAVYHIRQICSFFKKVKGSCSKERDLSAIEKFEQTDVGLPERIELTPLEKSISYEVVASLNFGDSHELCLPKHGPGATFERTWGNQKYLGREFYARWIGIFDPIDLYGYAIHYQLDRFRLIAEEAELPCRLALVPKTMKTPRLIAVEPTAMQYAQQYIGRRLITGMSSSSYTRHIDFADQAKNRSLARIGSITGQWATIDLSEASDRVSVALVKELFNSDPVLRDSLLACRSTKILLPDGRVLPLRKYSTSGSALTFPTETLVFFLIALSAVVKDHLGSGVGLKELIQRFSTHVHVYGDDIIVPAESCSAVEERLEHFGLKVNRKKTFSKGFFRESCGGDYFKGYDVTPKYLRNNFSSKRETSLDVLASLTSTCNQLYESGCWWASQTLRSFIDSCQKLPFVLKTSPGLGFWHHRGSFDVHRISKMGGYLVRTLVIRTKPQDNLIDDYSALLKHHLSSGVQEDPNHLSRSTPKYRSRASLKWIAPY